MQVNALVSRMHRLDSTQTILAQELGVRSSRKRAASSAPSEQHSSPPKHPQATPPQPPMSPASSRSQTLRKDAKPVFQVPRDHSEQETPPSSIVAGPFAGGQRPTRLGAMEAKIGSMSAKIDKMENMVRKIYTVMLPPTTLLLPQTDGGAYETNFSMIVQDDPIARAADFDTGSTSQGSPREDIMRPHKVPDDSRGIRIGATAVSPERSTAEQGTSGSNGSHQPGAHVNVLRASVHRHRQALQMAESALHGAEFPSTGSKPGIVSLGQAV